MPNVKLLRFNFGVLAFSSIPTELIPAYQFPDIFHKEAFLWTIYSFFLPKDLHYNSLPSVIRRYYITLLTHLNLFDLMFTLYYFVAKKAS